MKKIFSPFVKLLAVLFAVSALLVPAKTFAADDEGMAAFREILEKDSDPSDRIFRQDTFFLAMPFIGELDFLGMVDKGDVFKATGDFSYWIYNDDGSTTEKIVPFYLVQDKDNLMLYFKQDKKWEKIVAPTLAAKIADMIATPTGDEIQKMIDGTKGVTILQDDDKTRTLLIEIDGNKLADEFQATAEEDNDSANVEIVDTASRYIDTALRNGDMWYMWTVDKSDWHTVVLQYNFSSFLQGVARAALNDPKQVWPDEMRQMLERIAFYSELRSYTMYPADPSAKKKFEIPKEVLKAKDASLTAMK
ncbi:MAG: hypothetical protein IJ685_08620 [Selenomonadaceae bacterium]|nr:hypothetical protein [Selenomonadaceae bacterium]